jgi:hypothetical protein
MELVFLLEEQSAQEMLHGVLPRLPLSLPPVRYIVFEGKQDLKRNIEKRIRGYRTPDARFVVVRDQDSDPDCKLLKSSIKHSCALAGRPDTIVRIMCRELETIYLADLQAVGTGLGLASLARNQGRRKFRAPDLLASPSRELSVLTAGLYQKIGGSRAIAPHLDLDNVRSPSFRALIAGICQACA